MSINMNISRHRNKKKVYICITKQWLMTTNISNLSWLQTNISFTQAWLYDLELTFVKTVIIISKARWWQKRVTMTMNRTCCEIATEGESHLKTRTSCLFVAFITSVSLFVAFICLYLFVYCAALSPDHLALLQGVVPWSRIGQVPDTYLRKASASCKIHY